MKLPPAPSLLAFDRYELDEGHPHIEVDNEICETYCTRRSCLTVCPAEVYREEAGKVVPEFAACLECGTCVVACDPGALRWHYPDGGFGIQFRYG